MIFQNIYEVIRAKLIMLVYCYWKYNSDEFSNISTDVFFIGCEIRMNEWRKILSSFIFHLKKDTAFVN